MKPHNSAFDRTAPRVAPLSFALGGRRVLNNE